VSRFPLTAARVARSSILSLLLLVPVVVAGCSSGGAGSPPASLPAASPAAQSPGASASVAPSASAAAAFPVTLTDDDGTQVTLPAEPQKIVSLTPAETEILFAMGAGDRVVGKVEDIANYPPEAAAVPVMGRFDGVDVEQIVAADADLVIAGGSGGTPPDAIEQLRALGVPVLVVYAETVDDVLGDIELTAAAVGQPTEGEALIAEMRRTFDAVGAATADLEKPRVFVETGNEPAIYGIADDSVYAEMVELAGGQPVTTGSVTNWEMSAERLVTEDPEIILLADANYGVTAEDVTGRSGWDGITAVKEGAIHPVDDIIVTRPGPRLTDGLLELLSKIHPDVNVGSDGY
jgi:cobalamin transport system substrate-binding protein